jgi:hypothetical protein
VNLLPQTFTASEIGKSIGQSRFTVHRALDGVTPSAIVIRGSNKAKAWTLAAMPHALRDAFARGPLKAYPSPIPLAELHPECVEYATKLHAAFASTFANRFPNDTVSAAELAAAGVEHYRKAFGHPISPRHWQRLLDRITTRDAGAENWGRLDLYLPDEKRLRRQPEAPREVPVEFANLENEFNMWANPLIPTFTEEKNLYLAAFDWLETTITDGCTETDAKRSLITWLHQRAGLSTCENTMRRLFNAKLKAWRDGGPDALTDGRQEANAARRAPALPKDIEEKLVHCAACEHDMAIAPAFRQCYPQWPAEIRNRYSCFLDGTRRKDYVPAFIRQLAPKVKQAWIEHQGPTYAKMNGPFIIRNHTGLNTGDIVSTDDATLEVYGATTLPAGGFKCIRGQFFPWIDEKSKFVFAYSLLAKEHFNSRDILAGLYDALETIGIPRKKLRTENGIFKRSRWLGRGEEILWSQNRELFTDRLGIEWSFTQPRNPRGKIVENILRLIIKRLSSQAMFVGNHEQVTAREEVQWAIREVNDGRKHPHDVGMFTFDEWEQELENVIGEYNAEVQQDSVVYQDTLSPLQAYEKFLLRDASGNPIPLAPFPHELRLMLSQPRSSTVGGNGVRTFIPGTKLPVYFDSVELSRRRNEKVFIRIDPGNLDEILVTDLRGEKPLLVPRLVEVPADGATAEQMHTAMASIKARSEYGKTYYRSLRPDSHPGFSPVILDVEARNTLVEIETQRGANRHQRHVETAHQRTVATRRNRIIKNVQDFLK